MTMPRRPPKRAQKFRTLAEGYKVLASPLAHRFQMAAEVLEQVQPEPPPPQRPRAEVDDRERERV
jgi:hypothetical protein